MVFEFTLLEFKKIPEFWKRISMHIVYMYSYSFRITDWAFSHLDQLFQLLNTKCNKMIIASETYSPKKKKDVPLHYHGVINTSLTISSIRKTIRKYQEKTKDTEGNRSYSLKDCQKGSSTIDAALRYTCKGQSPDFKTVKIVSSKGYPEKEIKLFHKSYWEQYYALKKKVGTKGKPIFVQVYHTLQDADFENFQNTDDIMKWARQQIIKFYIRNVRTFPNSFQIKGSAYSLISMIYNEMEDPMSLDDIVDKIDSIMFKTERREHRFSLLDQINNDNILNKLNKKL